jgi:starch synthase
MQTKKRILFIANEMSPYLELTEFSETVNRLAVKANESGFEVRCIMPKFGIINERRHRLHEVVRLSGINVSIDDDDKWFEDNGLRTAFFCKGALETVKKFGWPPDIIHCSGWMTGLIPLYLKTIYKKEPVFSQSKVVYTIGEKSFDEQFEEDFLEFINFNGSLKDKDLAAFSGNDNISMMKGGATYADAITFGAGNVDQSLLDEFKKVRGKKVIPYNPDSDLTEYLQLYSDLAK